MGRGGGGRILKLWYMYVVSPQTKFYSEDFSSVGLRNMLIVDKRKQW